MLRRAASPKRWRCITSGRLGCRPRSAGGAHHHVCPCACSNTDFQRHTQPKRMARWAFALGVSVQAQNNNCSTSSKQSRRWLFNKLNFFSNVLLCFIQFASFPSKEKEFLRKHSKLTYLRKRKYASWFQIIFNQLAHNLTTTGFKASMQPRTNRIRCSIYSKI